MSFFSLHKNIKKSKNDKEKYSLVFNIGSGSISGGIIKFTEASGENIIYYAKELIPFQQEISIQKHLDLMKSALNSLANKIQTNGLKLINSKNKIERVFYVFSSPWSISQTKTILLNEKKLIRITENYLDELIQKNEKQFKTDILKSGKIIERKIIQIKSNGYIVNDIHKRQINNLEMSVLFTAVEESVLQIVNDAVSQVFHLNNVWCHSTALSIFSIIRNLYPQMEDFISLDISEEMTDLIIVKDSLIINVASIPFGRNHFIRELAVSAGVTAEIADSMIKMHTCKENNQLATLKLGVSMDGISQKWFTQLMEIFDSLKEKVFLPENIFLISNSDIVSFLQDKLQKRDYKTILMDNKKIRSNLVINDIMFRLVLMFLDNIYKI